MRTINLVIKRLFDLIVSGIGLTILSPFYFLIIILIKITMPGPVFFTQERIGRFLKPFRVYKFRSMNVDKNAEKNHDITKDFDRITPFGKILRRTKIDETA